MERKVTVVSYPDGKKLTVELQIDGAKVTCPLHESCYRADLIPGVELSSMLLVDGKLVKYRVNAIRDDDAVALLLGKVAK